MERQVGQEIRYITSHDLRGAIPHGWQIEASNGFYTPILGDQKALQAFRSLRLACEFISQYLAVPAGNRQSFMAHIPVIEQLMLF